jgi:hypothetical protein
VARLRSSFHLFGGAIEVIVPSLSHAAMRRLVARGGDDDIVDRAFARVFAVSHSALTRGRRTTALPGIPPAPRRDRTASRKERNSNLR